MFPYTEVQTRSVDMLASMSLLTGDSILVHLGLSDPHVIRGYGS